MEKYYHTRRQFFTRAGMGLGAAALSLLLPTGLRAKEDFFSGDILPGQPHFPARAKRVIYLFQSGGPSQIETFDYKPVLRQWHGKEIPSSLRGTQRNSGMVSEQASFPLVGSFVDFKPYGKSGIHVSDLLPYTAGVVDELCVVKSVFTEAINHEPAVMFVQTGSQQSGRPSMGAWLSYGLGSENENLPAFVVMVSKGGSAQPLSAAAWSNGFLPAQHQGVQFRSGKDPVLYLNNPDGISQAHRRESLDYIQQLNEAQKNHWEDPMIDAKIHQYEMAYRMQMSVPEVADLSDEPAHILDLYGPDARIPGTYAYNCIMARRLAEKDVRFIQLYHMGWDQHGGLPSGISRQCRDTDQPTAALIKDLKQRGLLEDTLVVWGGEFGRTAFSQGRLTRDNYGRDHHPGCFTMWMAGGGVKQGFSFGETDDFSYNVAQNGVHVHDMQATILHLMGMDHERLIFKHQGRRYRLTDVHGRPVTDILA
ncbi:MAG: DUF1501 domain-containing protein [Bacteroidia bacterium]